MATRQKWEYHIRHLGPDTMAHWDTQLRQALNTFGGWGWELVSLTPDGKAIFKRPKKGT